MACDCHQRRHRFNSFHFIHVQICVVFMAVDAQNVVCNGMGTVNRNLSEFADGTAQLQGHPLEKAKMKRIRTTVEQEILHNLWNKKSFEGNAVEEHVDLIGEGLQGRKINHLVALACRHFAPAHSLCPVCEKPICEVCTSNCEECGIAIGKCHATKVDGLWYCTACKEEKNRKSLIRLLVSPLIRFKGEEQ